MAHFMPPCSGLATSISRLAADEASLMSPFHLSRGVYQEESNARAPAYDIRRIVPLDPGPGLARARSYCLYAGLSGKPVAVIPREPVRLKKCEGYPGQPRIEAIVFYRGVGGRKKIGPRASFF
jgi:hypothetical protein